MKNGNLAIMSQKIRLFPSYSQKENQTTNHCLLILKMLYEENPKFLSETLSILLGESFSGNVGVQFVQQQKDKKEKGIPDGEISQEPFSILIETKLRDDFDENQLQRHLNNLKSRQGAKVLIALGNFEQDIPTHPIFPKVEEEAKKLEVSFIGISFEQFLQAIQLPYLPKNLIDAVSDLGEYFDENNLLPSWKYRLDVVNCARDFDNVVRHKIYTCPTKGAARQHQRSLYFGAYRIKCVEQIARIDAVVDLDSESESKLVWKNNDQSDTNLIKIALDRREQKGEYWYPIRVFVLGDFFPTNFYKASSGGMFGAKQYFDIKKLQVNDAHDLAIKLKDKSWENW